MRKKNITMITLLALTIMLTGCTLVDEPIAFQVGPAQHLQMAPPPVAQTESVEQQFTESQEDSTDAVQSAIMWSQKYDELLKTTEKLREEKNTLSLENTNLKYQLKEVQTELDRTKAELADANNFLHQMQAELVKWKSDVLGFRDEMRNAQTAQLAALKRVLRILGAEAVELAQPQTETDQGTE
ncbi:MAG: hypothetical protein ACYTFK_04755 [Planctomycetota bacterium]|jgi:chromosome segregation ATPase